MNKYRKLLLLVPIGIFFLIISIQVNSDSYKENQNRINEMRKLERESLELGNEIKRLQKESLKLEIEIEKYD